VPFNYFNNLDFTPIRNRILPEMDEGSIVLDYESPGTSLEETDRMLVEVEKIIHRIQWRPIAEERVRKWAFYGTQ
jgi:Cu/Ag efflux pump CusA